ncbi:GTP-binding protein YcjX [Alteromonas pelagimontana]|uniref:GTP-binding protein YcjX n=1 Tax=Alteromonas pelagimontana TaxID=1858656 RepID=A0A6M4MET4_9ALTE|nr:YcjX family protein [Alteromonas pelagimontana]QJR81105.1 GTP-binding protein YcjX [Alteromonas pelagimontana]
MSQLFKTIVAPVESLWRTGTSQIDDWFLKETHRFTITGLSRSGKSMLFTSLMTILKYRSEEKYNCLPLLKRLPVELVESMWLEPIKDFPLFPIEQHIAALESGNWPHPTEELYGFKLVIRLKQTNRFTKFVLPHKDVVFEFIDYPGEWITDLPMLSKSYAQWSDSAWAQQMSEPQNSFAEDWHEFVRHFDFDSEPTPQRITDVVTAYRGYLHNAKTNGISMIQPGSFLISGSGFDSQQSGFAPLPSKITSDVSHPWYQVFNKHYNHFANSWLAPLKASTFKETDKQIILIDLFEGLNHSKQHLYQLKETLSHLAETFVYGNPSWFEKNVLRKNEIGRVAFVATKADLVPQSQKANLLSLLRQVSEGATAKFKDKPVVFEHFLVSAIQATDPGTQPNSLRYTNAEGQYMQASFEDLPANLKDMAADEHFPVLPAQVPADYLPRMLNGRGLDRLFQFLLG